MKNHIADKIFCSRVRERKEALGYTVIQMSSDIGIDSKLLKPTHNPKFIAHVTLINCCDGLNTSADYLLNFSDDPTPYPPSTDRIATIPRRWKTLLCERGFDTIADFSRHAGISKEEIGRILNGASPSVSAIYQIAKTYGVSADWLLCRADNKEIINASV